MSCASPEKLAQTRGPRTLAPPEPPAIRMSAICCFRSSIVDTTGAFFAASRILFTLIIFLVPTASTRIPAAPHLILR